MRKLFAILLFTIALVSIGNAQQSGKPVGDATIWTDSLGYSDSDTLGVADSTFILRVDFNNEIYRVYVDGNANSSVDTIFVRSGSIRYFNETEVDTIWDDYLPLKNNAWGDVSVIVNGSANKSYTLYAPVTQLLQFGLSNYRATLTTRNTVLTIQGLRRR